MRTQSIRWIAGVSGFAAIFASLALAARAQESAQVKPIAVIAVSSYDELTKDADFLGGLIGQQLSPMIEQMLNGVPGLDRTKPVGVLVTQYGLPPTVVACVPVTDFNAFVAGLQPMGVTAQDGADGLKQIAVGSQTLFAKEVGGWALASLAPQMLEGLPADPSAEFAEFTKEHDVVVRLNVQNIPAEIRQQWADFLSATARMGIEKGANETDEAFAQRRTALDARLDQQIKMFNDLDQFTLGLAVDREGQRAYFDVIYTAVAGSKLAEDLGVYKESTTNFAGFAQDGAAVTFSLAVSTKTMDEAEINAVVGDVSEKANQAVAEESGFKSEESRESMKAAVGDFVEALRSTLAAGALDGGGVLNLAPDSLSLVIGGAVGDPSKIQDGFKKITEIAKAEGMEMPEVKWDAESYQDVKFHVMTVPHKENTPPSAKALLGDNLEMAVGVGEKAVYFALGKNWLDAVKKVVDDSAANPGKSTLPMELKVSASPIAQFVGAAAKLDGEQQPAAVADMVSSALAQSPGHDHARLVAEPIENGVRTRFEVESGALQAIATGAMASQMPAPPRGSELAANIAPSRRMISGWEPLVAKGATMASNGEIEHRLALLEHELARLKQSLDNGAKKSNWVDQIAGAFKDDPDFEEIVRLGREIRQSQSPESHG